MTGAFRFVGYAIVSADGMLAAADREMPASLKIEADQRFFETELDHVDLVVHGRNSHERQPRSPLRRRLILTRQVSAPVPDPQSPKAVLWNPTYASFEEAAARAGVQSGVIAPIGGTDVFSMFLDRYDSFFLSEAHRVQLPGGVPVFDRVPERTPAQILTAHGLKPQLSRVLDEEKNVTLTEWRRG